VHSKAEETCYHDGHQLAALLVDHQKRESIASENKNSLFPLLTGFWSMLLLPVCYTFYSQPGKSLTSTVIYPELLTFVLFTQPCTMVTHCSYKMSLKTNLAKKEKSKGSLFNT